MKVPVFGTDKTTDAHPIWMSLSAGCTLDFERVKIRFLRSVEWMEIGDPDALLLAGLEDRYESMYPGRSAVNVSASIVALKMHHLCLCCR